MKFDYPKPRKDESVVDNYHGTKVADPYRWMEDPDAPETQAYVEAQNKITFPYLDSCPIKKKIKDRTTEMWDFAKYGCPKKHGSRYFYSHNSGLQNQSVLYIQDSLDGEAREFLNPNKLSADGTTAINGTAYSEDGRYFAYGLSKSGSDWITIHFKDIEKEEDLKDTLEQVKFCEMTWTHDNKGIFYKRYLPTGDKADGTETEANINQKLFYHRLGEPQDKDVLVVEWLEEPKWMTAGTVSHCGRYLLITVARGTDPVNRLYFCDLQALPDGINGIVKRWVGPWHASVARFWYAS